MRSDWKQLLKEVVEHGRVLSFISNGWVLNDEIPALRNLELMVVGISLDGNKFVYDSIRQPGSFTRAVHSLLKPQENNIEETVTLYVTLANEDNYNYATYNTPCRWTFKYSLLWITQRQ